MRTPNRSSVSADLAAALPPETPENAFDNFAQLFHKASGQPQDYLELLLTELATGETLNPPKDYPGVAYQARHHQTCINDLVAVSLSLEEAAGKIFRFITSELKNHPLTLWGHLASRWTAREASTDENELFLRLLLLNHRQLFYYRLGNYRKCLEDVTSSLRLVKFLGLTNNLVRSQPLRQAYANFYTLHEFCLQKRLILCQARLGEINLAQHLAKKLLRVLQENSTGQDFLLFPTGNNSLLLWLAQQAQAEKIN